MTAPAVQAAPRDGHREGGPHGPSGRTAFSAFLAGGATVVAGAAGVALGLRGLSHTMSVRFDGVLPLAGARFTIDPLGGMFMAVIGAVCVAVGIYAVGYARREPLPSFALAMLPLLAVSLLLVPAAGSVTTFLFCWELMALTSLGLLLAHHERDAVRRAAAVYAAVGQLGFAALLVGLLTLSASAGEDAFAALAGATGRVGPGTRDVVFLLTLAGFGAKAGLVPLHAWLPRAHPEAPSPVSALMSGAMVNLGIYGLLRFDGQLLGPGPHWWGLALLAVGGATAVFGVLHAVVANDLKRLLAFSTVENMGMVTLALGAALLLSASGARTAAALAATAALVWVVAHAAFKTLAFLAAGSVLAGTGERELDRLGGLARPMPATSVLFGIGALGACGLPLGAGFAGEWLLLQSLIHAPMRTTRPEPWLALTMPLALGVVALTAGLATAAMAKALGVGFLGRPRSAEASDAREANAMMVAGMCCAAAGCAVLAVAPGLLGPGLGRVLATLPGLGTQPHLGFTLRVPGGGGSVSPGWLAAASLAVTLAVAMLARGRRRGRAERRAPLWMCGENPPTARMQYTATSFAQPLQRVFDDVLRPDVDLTVRHYPESRFLLAHVAYRARQGEVFERFLYRPVVRAVDWGARLARHLHSGSVHRYVGFGALGLVLVLLVAR